MSKVIEQKEYIFGVHAVRALIENRPSAITLLYLARDRFNSDIKKILKLAYSLSCEIKIVPKDKLDLLLPDSVHQGVIAEVHSINSNSSIKTIDDLREPYFLLILDGVQDPRNLGAILRSANAFGVQAVIAPKDRACGITPIVRKVACGAAEVIPFIPVTNLVRTMQFLKERGVWFYGAAPDGVSIEKVKFTGSIGLVLGAEGSGLRRLTREKCDFLVGIPMCGSVPSLNVSVASGIFIFEAAKQRHRVLFK